MRYPVVRYLARIVVPALACLQLQSAGARAAIAQNAQDPPGPSFKDVIGLRSAGAPRISPDGSMIAFTVRTADWENNRFDQEIWLGRRGEEPFQLTRTADGSSSGQRWSPDGRWLAFLADRGEKQQIYLIAPDGGEAKRLTKMDEGVNELRWSADGARIAFTATDPESRESKAREKQYGDFAVEDTEYRMSHLWIVEVDGEGEPRRLTEGDEFSVGSFAWSPDGQLIAFEHRPQPTPDASGLSDVSVVEVASGAVRLLVAEPGGDYDPIWSPDGGWILINTMLQDTAFHRNRFLARVPVAGGGVEVLTGDFDENPSAFAWTKDGIWFLAAQRTSVHIFTLDPRTRRIERFGEAPEMVFAADVSSDEASLAFLGQSSTTLGEIYRTPAGRFVPERITSLSQQVADWPLGSREVLQWTSRDGASVEGVLFKPADYDPERRYPLLVAIHGGPTATSRPALVASYVYPITQWLGKGAVVLMPNYRGSAGYGEAFRSLNVRNLGVGDAWDVLSGVEFLVERGIVDPQRMGAMGWSQGGYISAFLTTNSDVFRAISVGAGISDWMTYYVNTDIHRFTRNYLKATPWEDPEIYAKTSPITYIRDAQTPTLIQHGEFDRRVPIPNAYELYQSLQDVGVETRLIVYKGFGHGISKPKEQLAATWHNWQWFARHVWGEDVEMPLDLEGEEKGPTAEASRN